jgi:hypothetical protein
VLRRRSVLRRVSGVNVAGRLAAVAAVGLFAVFMGSWSSDRIVEITPVKPIVIDETSLESVDEEPVELRVYRRAALISGTPAAPRVAKRPGTQPL